MNAMLLFNSIDGFSTVPMWDCAICEIRMGSINRKGGLMQTNDTELLLKAMHPDSGDSGSECSDVSAGVALEPSTNVNVIKLE